MAQPQGISRHYTIEKKNLQKLPWGGKKKIQAEDSLGYLIAENYTALRNLK